MKVVAQTTDEIVLKNDAFSVIMNFLFPLIFIVVGCVFLIGSTQLQDTGYLPIAFVLIAFGVLYILFTSHQRILIDKQRGQIVDTKKRLVMSRSKEYKIEDVQRVELRKIWRTARNRNQQGFSSSSKVLNLSTFFIFKDGSDLLFNFSLEGPSILTINGLGAPSGGKETQKAIDLANNVAQFLNVPFEEIQQ